MLNATCLPKKAYTYSAVPDQTASEESLIRFFPVWYSDKYLVNFSSDNKGHNNNTSDYQYIAIVT